MEIICNQNELNNAIQLVSKAVASRPTHPILANILLTADEGTNKISVTGFDLNLGIQTSFDGTVKNSGAITIPSKLLSEIVNKLPTETPVSLKVEESLDNILIKSDRGSFNLKGIPSDEYPNLPFVESGTSLNIDPSSFLKALKSTIFASSNDDSKQLLTGVNFTFKQNYLESASTDGHRLAVAIVGNEENNASKNKSTSIEDDLSVTIPTRSLSEIEKLVKSLKKDVYAFKIGYQFFFNFGLIGYKKIYSICPKIFLDLKLHDIPNTVKNGLEALNKIKPILTTIHISGGDEMMKSSVKDKKFTKILGVSILDKYRFKTNKKIL